MRSPSRRGLLVLVALFSVVAMAAPAAAQPKPKGMMAARTPNLDRLAAEGMRLTDYSKR